MEALNAVTETQNTVFVTINGQDWQKPLAEIGLEFEATEREIMDKLSPMIQEEFGEDITNYYKVRKAVNSQNIFVIPASVAGN